VHVGNIKFFIYPTNAHNSYQIVKLLKSFKIIFSPACFGLHKRSSGSSQPVLRQVTMLISVIYIVVWSYRYCGCLCYWKFNCIRPIVLIYVSQYLI